MLNARHLHRLCRSLHPFSLKRGLATATSVVQASPLSEKFGAEVWGIDWSQPLSPEVVRNIIELQNKWGVLAFRKTGLTDDTHVLYSRNFGALETAHAVNKPRRASSVHLYDAGNLGPDDKIIQQNSRAWWHTKANGLWHTDSSFRQHRSSYSALRAVELPPAGGQTRYADMRSAYAELPIDLKDAAENAIAEHWIWHSRKLAAPGEFDKPTEEEKIAIPPAYHQIVQLSPDGVNKTLFLASHIRRIVGMSEGDSTALIKAILDHSQQEKYQIGVQWKNIGDIVQWDNRCTMHRATAFKDQENRRDMRRTTVFDHGHGAFGVKHQLGHNDVDYLVGGGKDIAGETTPETQTQQQIFDL